MDRLLLRTLVDTLIAQGVLGEQDIALWERRLAEIRPDAAAEAAGFFQAIRAEGQFDGSEAPALAQS